MNARFFPVLVGTIGLSLLGGCTPAIVGEWSLTGWWIEGEEVELNYSYHSYDGYSSRSVYATGELKIDDDHVGSFAFDEDSGKTASMGAKPATASFAERWNGS